MYPGWVYRVVYPAPCTPPCMSRVHRAPTAAADVIHALTAAPRRGGISHRALGAGSEEAAASERQVFQELRDERGGSKSVEPERRCADRQVIG